jgi:hypothetical protein
MFLCLGQCEPVRHIRGGGGGELCGGEGGGERLLLPPRALPLHHTVQPCPQHHHHEHRHLSQGIYTNILAGNRLSRQLWNFAKI